MFFLQFYTFLETSLVTLSLLPYFMAFFTDEEISGPPTKLAVSFVAFGEFLKGGFLIDHLLLFLSYS